MDYIASRLHHVKPSPTLAINAKAKALLAQGLDILDLSTGEPDFDTPDHIKMGAIEAMHRGQTKYTVVDGTPSLKKAICSKLKHDNGFDFDVQNISVGTGGKQILFNAMFATLNPGDEVIIPAPYWVTYPDVVRLAQGEPVIIECPATQGFKLTADQLQRAITPRTKWVIFNSPSNPTGATYSADDFAPLMDVLRHYPQIMILSDEIYEYIVYDGRSFVSPLNVAPDLKDRTLILNGVSKAFAMTGWRIGYGAGPKDLIHAMATIQSQSTSNPCSVAQAAAEVALISPCAFFHDWLLTYTQRRDMALGLLNNLPGIECIPVEGAFYLYVNCGGMIDKKIGDKIIKNDVDVADYLLDTARVAVVPGAAFGLSPYIRLSFATNTDVLEQACHRLRQALVVEGNR